MADQFWLNDPSVLFRSDTWYAFVPQPTMSVREALNAVLRFAVYLSALLMLATRDPRYAVLLPAVMICTIALHALFPKARAMITEGFSGGPIVTGYRGTDDVSLPTSENPFMNPMLTDILDNPNRPPAAEITGKDVRQMVNYTFGQTSDIFMDTSDVYQQVQSQRNFYSVPADDHAGLLQFLGKNAQATNGKLLNEGFAIAKGTAPERAA